MTGTYSDIVEIVAPSTAAAGETVPVTISIRNLWTASLHVAAEGIYDSEVFIDWPDYWIPAGETHSFSGSFIMPDRDVTISAHSYYEAVGGYYYFDDEAAKGVSLAAPPGVYEGTISRKELKYDATIASIPVY